MNSHIMRRLAVLEMKARHHITHKQADADRAERHRILSCLANDPEAMTAYNDWLAAISTTKCRHGKSGLCWTCLKQAETVQAAWQRYQARMHVVQHHTTQEGGSPYDCV